MSAARNRPPFRAEHVGSLLRPVELRAAFRAFNDGAIDADEFRVVQDESIRDAVKMQQDVGLELVTDGEFRRQSYWSHFVESVDGLDVAQSRFDFRDGDGELTHFLSPRVVGKVAREKSISGEEFDFLTSVTDATPKITMPSPPTMHFWAQPGAAAAAGYADDDEYLADLAKVYQEEIADLAARGATYVQVDDVPLAMLCDADLRARIETGGENPEADVQRYVELMNACIGNRPDGVTVGMHLCRGNFKGRWLSDGGYAYVARKLFNDIQVDAFFLEYDTERAGSFEPLAAVPEDKVVVLGLVSTKTPVLEKRDALIRRIDEASRFVPLERLALSPQCGFASTVAGNPVTLEDQVAKLALIVDVANEVWG
jgi:5-methyltetrahydropteroyltriglutamate--homocysteine methyltransferase